MRELAPIDVRELFPGERAALLDLLVGLDDAAWGAPTICAGWSVKDVVLHLLGDDVGRLSSGRDRFPNPAFGGPDLDVSTWTGLVEAIDRQNAAWVSGTRRLSPRLLSELLRFTGEATGAYVRSLDLAALGGSVDWAGPDPAPIWLDLAREYTERWVHQQHVRDAVGRPGLLERRWLAPVLATFARALPRALADADAPVGSRVRLAVRDEAGGTWLAARGRTGWRLVADEGAPATATATLDQDLAWRLLTRGITPATAAPGVTLIGDQTLAGRVLGMVAILA